MPQLFPSLSKSVLSKFRLLPLILGLLLMASGVVWHFYPQDLSFSAPPTPAPTPIVEEIPITENWVLPLNIQIPGQDIDLPVIPSQIIDGKWQTYSTGVSFLSSSALIGQPGNSIFYGHNWAKLLGKLKRVQVGDSIVITATESAQTEFIVREIKIVSPEDVSILEPKSEPTLTLYTCIGVFDSQRLVVIASPVPSK